MMKLRDEEIVAHSISFLLAEYETTANTLAYASFLLALSPQIQEKLQATIDEHFENNPVSAEWNTILAISIPFAVMEIRGQSLS